MESQFSESKMKQRAVFLDLNGTIVLPLKPESLDEMTLIPGTDLAIMRFSMTRRQRTGPLISSSYTIGDSPQDVEAARRFGGTGCVVRTGWVAEDRFLDEARPFAEFIGDSISDAAEWIVGREQKNGEQRQVANG